MFLSGTLCSGCAFSAASDWETSVVVGTKMTTQAEICSCSSNILLWAVKKRYWFNDLQKVELQWCKTCSSCQSSVPVIPTAQLIHYIKNLHPQASGHSLDSFWTAPLDRINEVHLYLLSSWHRHVSSAQVRTLRGPPSDAFLDNCPVEHPAEPKSQSSADDFLILLLHYSAGDSLMVAVTQLCRELYTYSHWTIDPGTSNCCEMAPVVSMCVCVATLCVISSFNKLDFAFVLSQVAHTDAMQPWLYVWAVVQESFWRRSRRPWKWSCSLSARRLLLLLWGLWCWHGGGLRSRNRPAGVQLRLIWRWVRKGDGWSSGRKW